MAVAWLASIGEWLAGSFLGTVAKKAGGLMSSMTSMIFMYIVHATFIEAPDIGIKLAKAVTDTYYNPSSEWREFAGQYVYRMTGSEPDYSSMIAAPPGSISTVASAALGKAFFDPMLKQMIPKAYSTRGEAVIQPEDGLDSAHRFLAMNLQFQMSAWMLHLLGDWHSFGSFKSLKDLPNAISWSFGIGWLSWLVMGVPFRMGISDPLERYYNLRLRPSQLNFSQVMDLWHKELITTDEVSTKLNELGYSPELKWRLMAANWKIYSRAEIKDQLLLKIITDDQAIEYLKYNDVARDQAEMTIGMWKAERSLDITRKIVSKAEDLYVRGIIDESRLDGYLTMDLYNNPERALKHIELNLEKMLKVSPDTKTGNLSPANIGALYKIGEYSYAKAREMVLQDNFNPDQVDDYLKLYAPLVPKESELKEATAGVVARLFIAGQVSEGELRGYLIKLGYSDAAIEYMIRDYKLKIKVPVVKVKVIGLTAAQIGRLFEEEMLTGREAIERLRVLGMVDADIELFLNLYLPAEEPTPEVTAKQLSMSTIGRLYKAGEINYIEAIKRFMDQGLTQADSVLYLMLYGPE